MAKRSCTILFFLFHGAQATRLYVEEDPVVILTSATLKPSLLNSSTVWLVQFYSSWCGHCIQYSPTWKALAGDVEDWDQVVRVGVLDCADESNFATCKDFGIHFYPTFRYFRAHSQPSDVGETYRGADRGLQTVRQLMVNVLQNHTSVNWPDMCPPLGPYRSSELLALMGHKSQQYTAIIVEEPDSYVGREVILDLLQYTGVVVRRALSSDLPLVDKLGITAFPSAYLLQPNGTHTHLHVQKRLRFFFSSFLKLLPGVHRRSSTGVVQTGALQEIQQGQQPEEEWRDFDRTTVYMSDLESALHYLLRVELATHHTLEGEELKTFKDFVTVVAKLYPGRQSVVKLLETLLEWLLSLPLDSLPYHAILDLVNNKMRISGLFLGGELRWVGCQGSRAGLRGYPCSLWTLFHVLTVQAARQPNALSNTALEDDPQAVLQTMRRYIGTFFGCQECGRHFEEMAAESLPQVKTPDQAVLWLWRNHNRVNSRLAGSLSEDPQFPKSPWPSPDLCPACHEEKEGVHVWNEDKVLEFLKQHYGASNLSPRYALLPTHALPPPAGGAPQPKVEDGGAGGDQQQGRETPEEEVAGRSEVRSPAGSGAGAGVTFLGLGFSSVDMSLCVVLYVCSCLFLMLLFFFFRLRSRRWRVRYNKPYV
ncbi:sulfhydryl oxidase 2 [Aplochiton taeniatus]